MTEEKMTLIERLRNPAYVHLPGNAVALHVSQTRDTMSEAADKMAALLEALKGLVDQRDRPHGFPDNAWYEPAFEKARATLAELTRLD